MRIAGKNLRVLDEAKDIAQEFALILTMEKSAVEPQMKRNQ